MTLQKILIRVCRIVSVFQESVYSCYQDEMMVCHCQEFKQYTFFLLPGRYICTIYEIVLLQTIHTSLWCVFNGICQTELGRLHIFTHIWFTFSALNNAVIYQN